MSESSARALEAVQRALGDHEEADDALRVVVELLAAEPGVDWAGIAFLEEGSLVLGPQAGTPSETRRATVPIVYEGGRVGELRVDGEAEMGLLEQVAALVSPYVLIGWDTGGEAWEP